MYPPIEHHGIIGDLRTAALVSVDGTIDFFCPLRFDGPTLFASLLDDERGGFCAIRPAGARHRCRQLYLPETNVLATCFVAPEGVAEIVDFMPVGGEMGQSTIVRRVSVTRGTVSLRFECAPAFAYASRRHEITGTPDGVRFDAEGDAGVLLVRSDRQLIVREGTAVSDLTLRAGEHATFVLTASRACDGPPSSSLSACEALLADTVRFWRQWVGECRYQGRWREMVVRSALALKLLTYQPTGAIVAAPTFGLPEGVGGVRNWDYRYTWLRDAAMTLDAFLHLGYHDEAARFMSWLKAIAMRGSSNGGLQIMYGIEGETDLEERELSTLFGYMGSRPVRIGNLAHSQLQLDVYGALLRIALIEVNAGLMIEYDRWKQIRSVMDSLARRWEMPDHGIWEVRGEPRRFLHSRLMCWVAVERAIRIAQARSLPAPLNEWLTIRDAIYDSIHRDFWSEERQSFVQYHQGPHLDASVLHMPLLEFISPADPRWVGTLASIGAHLSQDALVVRYQSDNTVDGLAGTEGAFAPCSFWYIEALTVSGEIERARLLFEKMLGAANDLGLYAEELGPGGEHLGNFPQALTHLALIQCALTLHGALEREGRR